MKVTIELSQLDHVGGNVLVSVKYCDATIASTTVPDCIDFIYKVDRFLKRNNISRDGFKTDGKVLVADGILVGA